MRIRTAAPGDVPALLDIYNYEVRCGVSTLDLTQRTPEQWQQWYDAHNRDNHPLLVAELDGAVAGYASLSPYREKEAYRSTVELSIYIHPDFRRRGAACALMNAILSLARQDDDTHTVVSVITRGNAGSTRLHEKFGFTFCGTIPQVGKKFGSYQDIDNYVLIVK